MTSVQIVVKDAAVRRMMARAGRGVDRAMRQATSDATRMIHIEQAAYPTAPAGTTYKRTNTLKNSWSTEVKRLRGGYVGVVGSNSNSAPYNRLVQDEDRQARVHRGRWRNTVQGTMRRKRRDVQRIYESRLRARLR